MYAVGVHRRRAAALSIAVLVSLGFSACSRFDASDRAQMDRATEQSEALGLDADPLSEATANERRCVDERAAEAGVDIRDVMADAGQTGLDARAGLFNAMFDCIPDIAEFDSYQKQLATTLNAGLGAMAGVSNSESGCLLQHIIDTADDPGRAFADGTDEADVAVYLAGFDACFDADTLAVAYGEEGAGPQVYGDDPNLDDLQDRCIADDDRACDLLYAASPPESTYSAIAIDCDGRGDGIEFCTDGLIVNNTTYPDPDSPGLERLRSECAVGQMISCDTLFFFAAVGSEFEQFGFTCGGEIAVGAIPNCRTRFAIES